MSIRISTGVVRASGYADKLRRVLVAATKGEVDPHEAIRIASYINQHIFKVLRENNVKKEDVIRIRFDIDIINGKIAVNWDSIKIEVYKPAAIYRAEDIESKLPEQPEISDEEAERLIHEEVKPEEEGAIYYKKEGKKEEIVEETHLQEHAPESTKKEGGEGGILKKILDKFKKIF